MTEKCIACGYDLHPALTESFHPSCMLSNPELSEGLRSEANNLKQHLLDIILWIDNKSPRTQQKTPGPSEMGDPCDRRLGYRIADVQEINNTGDPWAANVGTAIHAYLERGFQDWMAQTGNPDAWLTEKELEIDDFIKAHCDLYEPNTGTVIDWKTMNQDKMRQAREIGAPAFPGHIVQAHLYGRAYELAGYDVKRVALACLPRAGRIRDMHVMFEPYDSRIAQYAIDRVYAIAAKLVELNVAANSRAWTAIEATPSNSCGLCPWYEKNRIIEADNTGCPGA